MVSLDDEWGLISAAAVPHASMEKNRQEAKLQSVLETQKIFICFRI